MQLCRKQIGNRERTLLLANPPSIEIEIPVKGRQTRLCRRLFKKNKIQGICVLVISGDANMVTYVPNVTEASE